MKKYNKTIILIAIVLILILFDQGLKLYSIINLEDNSTVISYEKNNEIISTIITHIIVLGIIIKFYIYQKDRISINLVVIIAFLLAGGISNFIDKIFRGNVINYFKLFNIPMNLSFIFIVIGWVGLAAMFAWNTYKEREEQKKKEVKK